MEPVLRLAHEIAANRDRPPGLDLAPEHWVMGQDEEHVVDVNPDSARRVQAILSPPLRGTFDLAPSASLKELRATALTVALQALEELWTCAAFFGIRLINRGFQLSLEVRRKLDRRAVIVGNHGYNGALR